MGFMGPVNVRNLLRTWRLSSWLLVHQQDAGVSDRCCSQVKKIGQNPRCLCAAMLSNTAKSSGAKPEVAVTIPKRCNIADRPVGFKCGGQFYMLLPFTHPFLVLFSPAPLTGGQ
jgi:hypothetical protein